MRNVIVLGATEIAHGPDRTAPLEERARAAMKWVFGTAAGASHEDWHLLRVRKIANGVVHVINGTFIFENEAREWRAKMTPAIFPIAPPREGAELEKGKGQ